MHMTYNSNSIQVLAGLEGIRKRPGMYVGSKDSMGLHHIIFEVVDNSVDEYLAGYCKNIVCTLLPDNVIVVEDDGRGIPVGFHKKEKMSSLEVVFTTLHSGGKFDNNTYKVSAGLHGIGISATNALSDWLEVEVSRAGKIHHQKFSKGKRKSDVKVIGTTNQTGTKITFHPDYSIFEACDISADVLLKRFDELAYLNPKLRITFIDKIKGTQEVCYHPKGLQDFLIKLNKSNTTLHEPIKIKKKFKEFKAEILIQYNSGYSNVMYSYANNINTHEGGTHLNAVKYALLKFFEEYEKDKQFLKGTDLKILPSDVLEGITLIVNLHIHDPEFEGQTKIKLNNNEIREPIINLILGQLKKTTIPDEVLAKIIHSIKSRDALKKTRQLTSRKGILDKTLPGKLTDCSEKDASR